MRRGAKPAKPKVEAKPPIARKSPKNEGSRVRDLEKSLAEALKREAEAQEQQTATAEILRVISQSRTDVQPVFDTIVRSAAQLCHATTAAVFLTDGRNVYCPANYGGPPEGRAAVLAQFPRPLDMESSGAMAILTRSVVHVPDIEAPSTPEFIRRSGRLVGFRSLVTVPMLREGEAVGAIGVYRREPGRFSDQEVELLKTFADQAVIGIENVRLFKELDARNRDLAETLEQQTATGEILKAISQSPTDIQPVLDAVAANAARVCGATDALILRVDGADMRRVAHFGSIPLVLPQIRPVTDRSVGGRAILDCRPIHVDDILAPDDARAYPDSAVSGEAVWRTTLAVPLVREGVAIGAITIRRTEVRPFTDKQIKLLETFADQAVIAIENVRLFKELEARNRDLAEALDMQTATSDILRVISSSPTDVQPVFDAIVHSAVRLLRAYSGSLTRIVGDRIELAALTSTDDAGDAAVRARYPQPLESEDPQAQTLRDRAPLNIADGQTDPRLREATHAYARARGWRSAAMVPMLRHGEAVGTISVTRRDPGGFTDDEIALLKTFADQAVIAIENVRLFTELQEKNQALTEAHAQMSEALEQQTATGEILRVISQSPTAVQPVFDTIVQNARPLCGADSAAVLTYDGEQLQIESLDNPNPERADALRQAYPMPATRGHATGRAILTGRPVHIPDVREDPEYALDALRDTVGLRSLISVPLIRDGIPIGAITVQRWATPRPFSDEQIDLLKTFADQAVIAIENVRLFKELEARTGELTESVETLTALGEVSQALSSTLDIEAVLNTIVSRASELAGAAGCSIYEYDEAAEQFELRATHHYDPDFVAALRAAPLRKGEGLMGRAAEMREPVQIPDITQPGAYQSSVRDTLIRFGYRALLSVPLLREDQIIGSLSFNRKAPGEFSPEIVDVLKTFATQSALAIQNARLFREIEEKSRELEAASRHKSEFLANMSHELRTPLNAIIGFSEVLAARMFGEVNAKQAEYLQDILESGRHLLSLINDILDLSKIEAGRMELEPADFDLPSAIDNALILVRERATRRGILLGCRIDEGLGTIRGDERKVKQVLLNLLSNALKFTPEGGRIDVRAALHEGRAEVSVADTGVGIAPEDQAAVFEEFRQVGTADKKVEGTGLGLALSQKFVELHGGRIWVESELGRGATFTFTLPVS